MARERNSWLRRDCAGSVAALCLAILAAGCDLLEREVYPVMRSELQVEEGSSDGSRPRFRWLDSHRIVALVGERPDPKPRDRRRMIQSMKVWDLRTNAVSTLVPEDVDALCLADGLFRYMVRKTGTDGKEILEFYSGTEGAMNKVMAGRYDYLTCRPLADLPLPDWTRSIRNPETNLRRLRPEHGFLVIDRDSPTDWPRSIRLYRSGDGHSQGIDLSAMLGKPEPSPSTMGIYATWHAHREAYYVRALKGGDPSWWLHPDGRLEKLWVVNKGDIRFTAPTGAGPLVPTNAFPITAANGVVQGAQGDNGLYSLEDFKNPRRLVKGRIGQEIEVSPDGCKVAYANDERTRIDRDTPRHIYKLQVIDLCSEKRP